MKIFFLLLAIVAAARGARPEDACAVAGELSCDASGTQVTVCARASGLRLSVRDCAATYEVCAGGRCVPGASARAGPASRAVSCNTPGKNNCTSDCEFVTTCSNSNVWVVVNKCGDDTLCVNGECVSSSINICRTSSSVTCGESTKGSTFPNLEDCSSYFTCENEWEAPKIQYCTSGYYDPCSGNCSLASPLPCNHYAPCSDTNQGLDTEVFGNPSLHYTCAGGATILKKCETGYYDSSYGECLGTGVVCSSSC